jgi:hypothetical protein
MQDQPEHRRKQPVTEPVTVRQIFQAADGKPAGVGEFMEHRMGFEPMNTGFAEPKSPAFSVI